MVVELRDALQALAREAAPRARPAASRTTWWPPRHLGYKRGQAEQGGRRRRRDAPAAPFHELLPPRPAPSLPV